MIFVGIRKSKGSGSNLKLGAQIKWAIEAIHITQTRLQGQGGGSKSLSCYTIIALLKKKPHISESSGTTCIQFRFSQNPSQIHIIRAQAICSSNFLMWILGVISIPFEKTWPVQMNGKTSLKNVCAINSFAHEEYS